MNHHEFAELFPMLADVELQSLANDIAANGLQTPITTLDGKILDGRNRYRACEIAGVDPTLEEYLGADPLGFVISHNLHRRHLTESQRGMVAAKLATMRAGRPNETAPIDAVSKQEACSALKVGVSTLDRSRKIQRLGSPELNAAVESGEITVGAAYKVAELPHEKQAALVKAGPAAVKLAAKEAKASKSEPETMIVDGRKQAHLPSYKPDDATNIWDVAKTHLNRILANDKSRERVLKEVIEYCENRISSKK
jgi:ParB-like chromosome segregation protein Spo0J